MRRIPALLLIAGTLVAAGPDLLPREGSGWAGFGEGSSIRTKQTHARPGGVPSVTITTTTLEKVGEEALTLKMVTRNALGMEETNEQQVPRSGEAMPNERTETAEPARETREACGREFACTRRRTVVTAADGSTRTITVWDSADPALRVRRTVVARGTEGTVLSRRTLALSGLAREVEIDGRPVTCVEYRIEHEEGGYSQNGTALLSRDVPGGTVSMELEVAQGGEVQLTIHSRTLDFEVR